MARGQKACPNCSLCSGPRTKKCKGCGHEFTFKNKEEIRAKAQAALADILDGKVSISKGRTTKKNKPVGRPITFALPMRLMQKNGKLLMAVPPKSFTDEGILEWVTAMNDYVCPNSQKRFAISVVFQYLDKFVKDYEKNNRLRKMIRNMWVYWEEETYGLPKMSFAKTK